MASSTLTPGAHACDMVIVGGGIQGIMLAREASRSGRKVILLERGHLGAGTTANWFGILHGGLRYLQTFDVRRVRESAREQQWFLENYPEHVAPQAFLMPLYGRGLKRPSVFGAALHLNDLIGATARRQVGTTQALPQGKVLSREETVSHFPQVNQNGLRGGAIWYEAVAQDAPGLIEAIATDARSSGALLAEHSDVLELLLSGNAIKGVTGRCSKTGSEFSVSAPIVVLAAGPGNSILTSKLQAPRPSCHALAFNVLLDRPPIAQCGLAVSPPDKTGPMVFLYPSRGRTFAGTSYIPEHGSREVPTQEIASFLNVLNASVPKLEAKPEQILQVTAGLLPVHKPGGTALLNHDKIHHHATAGGPEGLVSITSVKFTTARTVALKVLKGLKIER